MTEERRSASEVTQREEEKRNNIPFRLVHSFLYDTHFFPPVVCYYSAREMLVDGDVTRPFFYD